MNILSIIQNLFNRESGYPSVKLRRADYVRQVSLRVEMMCSYAASLGFHLSYNPLQWPLPELTRILHSCEIYPASSSPADYVIKDSSWRDFAGPYSGEPSKALEVFKGATVDLHTPDLLRAPSTLDDAAVEDLKVYGITNDPNMPFYPVSKIQRESLVSSIYNLQIVGGASHIRVFVPTVPYSFEMLLHVCEDVESMAAYFEQIDWERVEIVMQSSVWREVVAYGVL